MSKLIHIGDSVRFKETELTNVTNITGIARTITSTAEANINSNVSLSFERLNIKFRTRQDSKYYSDWYSVNEFETSNVTTYSNVNINSDVALDIETEFVLKSIPTGWDEDTDYIEISGVSSNVTTSTSAVEHTISPDAEVSAVGRQNGLGITTQGTWDPYKLTSAQKLYDDLNVINTQTWGHEIEYVKVTSNSKKGKDYILREWNLFNVKEADIKCLKVLVPQNNFPDNKFAFDPMGVSYQDTFEIHIVDSYFKSIYGNNVTPEAKDFLYFPYVNRMYEVVSCYPFRVFNMQVSYWKCTLKKWEQKSNII